MHKYLENKGVSGLKYQPSYADADPSAGGGRARCPR